jgi:hypothetical protein
MSNCNGSWVFSIKQNVNFNFQQPTMFALLFFRKSCLIKSCPSFEDLLAYKIPLSYIGWCKFCPHLRSLNVPPSPFLITPSKEIMIHIKLVDMSMIFYCTELRVSKYICRQFLVTELTGTVATRFWFKQPCFCVTLEILLYGMWNALPVWCKIHHIN